MRNDHFHSFLSFTLSLFPSELYQDGNKVKTIGCILRTFRTREKDIMMILRRTFVLNRLDYCSQLWSSLQSKINSGSRRKQLKLHKDCPIATTHLLWNVEIAKTLFAGANEKEKERCSNIWKILEGIYQILALKLHRYRNIPLPQSAKDPNIAVAFRASYCNSLIFLIHSQRTSGICTMWM